MLLTEPHVKRVLWYISTISSPKINTKNETKAISFSQFIERNIAKGTTDPRVKFISQASSCTQIVTKFQFQNLD